MPELKGVGSWSSGSLNMDQKASIKLAYVLIGFALIL
jgi:hypothetical protein